MGKYLGFLRILNVGLQYDGELVEQEKILVNLSKNVTSRCSIIGSPPKSLPAGGIFPGEIRPGADFYTQMSPPAIFYAIKVLRPANV